MRNRALRGCLKDNLIRIIIVATLIIIAAIFASGQYGQPGENKPENYTYSSASGEKPPKSFWEKTVDDPVATFTAMLTVFTAVLAVVAIVQIYFLTKADNIARIAAEAAKASAIAATDQVSLSKEALITTERAFVYCERVNSIWTADKITELVVKWTFQPIWKNSGKTPTKRAINKISWWIGVDVGDIPANFDFTDANNPGQTIIGPDATMHGLTIDLDIDTLQKIRSNSAHAYIWGWIDYDDIFANTRRHRTEFCVEIQVTGNPIYKEGGFLYRMHGPFNGFDEDCYCKPKQYYDGLENPS